MKTNIEHSKLNAVVRIDIVSSIPNFNTPWQTKERLQATGSGVAIGGKRILTNAHNIAYATFVTVRKQSDDSLFEAEVLAVNHECDLALLHVKDESFFNDIEPMEIGTTPTVQTEIQVAGYPIGGDGLSITQGIISRIGETPYAHSAEPLLTAQLDAAINPGNSGGPVLFKNKVVGIAFQGLRRQQSIGYMIPTEIIEHFLADLENGKVDGFCSIVFDFMALDNPDTRRFLKMKPGQTGVLVYRIVPAAPKGYLEPNDVLLSVDGRKIANNGNIRLARQEPRSLTSIIRSKQIGETVEFRILRDGQEKTVNMPACKLQRLCPSNLHDTIPDYFIIGGFVFIRLTGNLLQEIIGDNDLFMAAKEDVDLFCKFKRFLEPFQKKSGEEIVLLHSVLADEVNIGLGSCQMMILAKVNGKTVNNLRQLSKIVEGCKSDFITFTMSDGTPLTLDISRLRAANPRILKRYQIAADRSASLADANEKTAPRDGMPSKPGKRAKAQAAKSPATANP